MTFGRSRIPREATFDLTPMVDVVLLLVIFFALTTHFVRAQLTPVLLPRERGDVAVEAATTPLIVDLDEHGRMSVLGVPVTSDQAAALAEQERRRLGQVALLVRADRRASAASLNRLALALVEAGVRDWKLATAGESP